MLGNKANIIKHKHRFYCVSSYCDIKPTVSLLTLREIIQGEVRMDCVQHYSVTSVHPEPLWHTTQVLYSACVITVT